MWGKITEAESVRRGGGHQDDFHPAVRFHPMVRVRRDLAGVTRLHSHAFLSNHDGATAGDDPATLPHVVPVCSSVSRKTQTFHVGLFAPGRRELKSSKRRLPSRRMHRVTHAERDLFRERGGDHEVLGTAGVDLSLIHI